MKNLFSQGDKKTFTKKVTPQDIASFESGEVHQVYSTFSLTRDAEWAGRLFVLEMKEDFEEGIGTQIQVIHKSPAFVEDTVEITACFEEISASGEIIVSFEAKVEDRLIASGLTGQRILPKEKINAIFSKIKSN